VIGEACDRASLHRPGRIRPVDGGPPDTLPP